FFSSRRRHTRSTRDWSSDMCSSDLPAVRSTVTPAIAPEGFVTYVHPGSQNASPFSFAYPANWFVQGWRWPGRFDRVHPGHDSMRSEERRVGKVGKSRRWPAE